MSEENKNKTQKPKRKFKYIPLADREMLYEKKERRDSSFNRSICDIHEDGA